MAHTLRLQLYLLCMMSVITSALRTTVIGTWTGGFTGKILVPVNSAIFGGWTLQLEFDEPIFDFETWNANFQFISPDKRVIILNNMNWNTHVVAGIPLEADFTAKIDVATSTTATVIFKENEIVSTGLTEVVNSWWNGFTGIVTVPIQSEVNNGWILVVRFQEDCPITVWSATSVYESSRLHVVVNDVGNGQLQAGTTLSLDFNGYPHGQNGSVGQFAFYRREDGPCLVNSDYHCTNEAEQVNEDNTNDQDADSQQDNLLPGEYNYNEVLHKSILFYEAQRSGFLPSDNRIPYRRDSATLDAGVNGEDLTGGWYDAGDHIKLGFTMGQSVTVLVWGLLEFRSAYEQSGELDNMLSCIRWATDYFLKCHVEPNVFYALVGNPEEDHAQFGRPEDLLQSQRPAYKVDVNNPGSDVAGEVAAALAASSIAFRLEGDEEYAAELLDSAQSLFEFAWNFRGLYSDSIPVIKSYYESNSFHDELAWAAAWMYRATQDQQYLSKAEGIYEDYRLQDLAWAFSWSEKPAGVQLLLFQLTEKEMYASSIEKFLDFWLPGGGITYTPGGLAWRSEWGSNRYAANSAFLATVAAKHGLRPDSYKEFARAQIGYMLGDTGRSFVVGFGTNPPLQPHHSSSSCPTDVNEVCDWNNFAFDGPNPQILYGALVGGPSKDDDYIDVRSDYRRNEVACDYNAGFQSAVAGLKALSTTQ